VVAVSLDLTSQIPPLLDAHFPPHSLPQTPPKHAAQLEDNQPVAPRLTCIRFLSYLLSYPIFFSSSTWRTFYSIDAHWEVLGTGLTYVIRYFSMIAENEEGYSIVDWAVWWYGAYLRYSFCDRGFLRLLCWM